MLYLASANEPTRPSWNAPELQGETEQDKVWSVHHNYVLCSATCEWEKKRGKSSENELAFSLIKDFKPWITATTHTYRLYPLFQTLLRLSCFKQTVLSRDISRHQCMPKACPVHLQGCIGNFNNQLTFELDSCMPWLVYHPSSNWKSKKYEEGDDELNLMSPDQL